MSRGLYWILAPFLAVCLIAFPLLIQNWTLASSFIVVALELFIVGLLIGLWDIERFKWALRGVAALIFAAYLAYFMAMFAQVAWWSSRRSQPSVINALAGLVFWGLPAFWFMIRGFRDKSIPERTEAIADPSRRQAWIREKQAVVSTYASPELVLQIDMFLDYPISFDELASQADKMRAGDLEFLVSSRRHLIRAKQQVNPPRKIDQRDIADLQELIDRERRAES